MINMDKFGREMKKIQSMGPYEGNVLVRQNAETLLVNHMLHGVTDTPNILSLVVDGCFPVLWADKLVADESKIYGQYRNMEQFEIVKPQFIIRCAPKDIVELNNYRMEEVLDLYTRLKEKIAMPIREIMMMDEKLCGENLVEFLVEMARLVEIKAVHPVHGLILYAVDRISRNLQSVGIVPLIGYIIGKAEEIKLERHRTHAHISKYIGPVTVEVKNWTGNIFEVKNLCFPLSYFDLHLDVDSDFTSLCNKISKQRKALGLNAAKTGGKDAFLKAHREFRQIVKSGGVTRLDVQQRRQLARILMG